MEQKKISYSTISGILFGVATLRQLVFCIQYFSVWRLLWLAAYAASTVLHISKKRDKVAVVPFAIIALLQLWGFILCFKNPQFISVLINLLLTIAYLGLLCIASANYTAVLQKYKKNINGLWYFPAVLAAATTVLCVFKLVEYARWGIPGWHYVSSDVLTSALTAITLLVSALWIAYPNGLPKKKIAFSTEGKYTQCGDKKPTSDEAYCSLVKHILLLLFTFGIWQLIWIYRVTGYTNMVKEEEDRNPTNKLLLCIFVPFYYIYWTYKTAQRIDVIAKDKGIPSDLSTLCLILGIFVPIIPPILLQDKMNNIVTADNTQPVTVQSESKKDVTTLGTAEELKNYKELLDMGVITQEEFDAKKKQLLGI